MSSELVPRKYQEELFIAARERNVVAAMETGSGKTFIAVLLIRWLALQLVSEEKKIMVFLVPKVPLVDQQAAFIRSQVPLEVRGYFGAMGVDLWDRTRWQRELAEADILVMTAQIYKDLIAHSYWSIAKTSLIVFDEAHHCCKNHVYNQIMRDHYFFTPPDQRPKIFGMTASPIWSPRNSRQALQDLERNLDVKVLAVKQHTSELAQHAPRPVEMILDYPPCPETYDSYPSPTLWNELDQQGLLPIDEERPFELESRYQVALQALGPCGADRFLLTEMERMVGIVERNQAKISPTKSAAAIDAMLVDDDYSVAGQIRRIKAILAARKYLQYSEKQIEIGWLSPKLLSLFKTLQSRKSSSFQAIIFVEQRQVAHALSWMLNGIPDLKEWIKSAPLVGHGVLTSARGNIENSRGMGFKDQQDIVREFREMNYNVLVATSVAEEGLDFQACHLIVIFDVFKTITSYVQSRGRARRPDSLYVVMLEEGPGPDRERYHYFRESEPELEKMYRRGLPMGTGEMEEEDDEEIDIHKRERYVVESTGAVLTYDGAISLLNNLCSLIPRDSFTKYLQPAYTIEPGFVVEVRLPSALPLPRDKLTYYGQTRQTKKEAKRSAAFNAVRTLHQEFQVFDDFLLPVRGEKAKDAEDADGNKPIDVSDVPEMMDVLVRDCWGNLWQAGQDIYLHPVIVDNEEGAMAMICSFQFEENETIMEVEEYQYHVRVGAGIRMTWSSEEERAAILDLLSRFTRRGIVYGVTTCRIDPPLACFYVPLARGTNLPDYDVMNAILASEFSSDWSQITPGFCGVTLVSLGGVHSRIYILQSFRPDLRAYNLEKFPSQLHKALDKGILTVSPNDPVIEVRQLERNFSRVYRLGNGQVLGARPKDDGLLLPQTVCQWISFPFALAQKYHLFPPVTRYLTDVYRVQAIHTRLSLPRIDFNLCLEALTLPCSSAGFNNQRLETLGDSVLKLCTAIHVFNKYEHRHEGQLSIIRSHSISNRSLLGKARKLGLEQFLTSEVSKVRKPYGPVVQGVSFMDGIPFVPRRFPRRSLQDCMEALLGATYISGGVYRALETGTALGLCFGGVTPWSERYKPGEPSHGPKPPLFKKLEEDLGYSFQYPRLLTEALTHPSFQGSDTPSYQRLEFLGDALIDMVVTDYLYAKYPTATPGQLSWARSRAVCSPSLASISVKRLSLHKYVFADSATLGKALEQALPTLLSMSEEDVVKSVWKMDPPKAASDLLESVVGAILIDSGYDLELSTKIVLRIMDGILTVLSPSLPLDPTSELMIWIARQGCVKTAFRKAQSNPNSLRKDTAYVVVHGVDIGGPSTAENSSSARAHASERARALLADENSEFYLNRLCDCERNKNSKVRLDTVEKAVHDYEVDVETVEGFARRAWLQVRDTGALDDTRSESSQSDDDEFEVPELDDIFETNSDMAIDLDDMVIDMVIDSD